jgi:hypothetical protein
MCRKPVRVWSKWDGNEGHFILEAGTICRPYLASHGSRVTQNSYVALPTHGSQTVKSVIEIVPQRRALYY